jgi:hypothetical protein
MKKMKENQNKNFTTDPLGNIIMIKNLEPSKFTAEFLNPKLNVLEKGNTQTSFLPLASGPKAKDSKSALKEITNRKKFFIFFNIIFLKYY